MRWKRLTTQEKRARKVERAQAAAKAFEASNLIIMLRAQVWTRRFAWLPYHDNTSGMVYFLEYVWCRAKNEDQYEKRFKFLIDQAPITVHARKPRNWEYRGGKDCPEIKQDPGGL